MTRIKPGDWVVVNRPDPNSGVSAILAGLDEPYRVLRIEKEREGGKNLVYLDTQSIPLLRPEKFVFDEEVEVVARWIK